MGRSTQDGHVCSLFCNSVNGLSGKADDAALAATWQKKAEEADGVVRAHEQWKSAHEAARVKTGIAQAKGKPGDAFDAEMATQRARDAEETLTTVVK